MSQIDRAMSCPSVPRLAANAPPLPGLRRDVLSLPEGDAVFQWPEACGPVSRGDLEAWLQFILGRVKREVDQPADSGDQ